MSASPVRDADVPVLVARGVGKAFGGVTALDGVDFELRRGEVHGLVGQNGAGKSTLVKIINGVHQPDTGSLELEDRRLVLASPSAARVAGIAMVFQEFSLIPTLSVAHNVFLGHEPRRRGGLIDDAEAERRTRAILERLGVRIDPRSIVGSLPVGSQQLVEIAKAMSWSPTILILDEPTASLSQAEIEVLFGVVRNLREQGVAMAYISHHLEEVLTICDTITVLRDGRVRLAGPTRDLRLDGLVAAITGRGSGESGEGQERPARRIDRSTVPALEVRGWTLGRRLASLELAVFRGEVLGLAGLLGSGRTSLLRSIVGLEPDVRGQLLLDGQAVHVPSPADALAAGVAYVPEDRRREGIVAGQSVQSNLLLGIWDRLVRHFLLDDDAAGRRADELIARLAIRTSGRRQLVEHLSGGNQQKVVVGRSMAGSPGVLLLDDPTAGIDIGSRRELLGHIRRYADGGGAVLLVSSELEELAGIADRVVILSRGRIERVLDPSQGDALSEASLLAAIHGAGTLAA